MKRGLGAVWLMCALVLTGCDVNEMSSLREISRPYAAEYTCKKLQLGGEDLLGEFDYIKLNLGYYGDYTLFYASETAEGETSGRYELSPEKGTLTLHAASGGEEKTYVFSYEKGTIRMRLLFNEKLLLAEFSAAGT